MHARFPVPPVRYFASYGGPAYAQPVYADAIGGYSPYYAVVPYAPPNVPSLRQQIRAQVLDLNREFAGWLGLDPRYTLSTNMAIEISARTSIPFRTAKQLFHGGVAGGAAAIIGFFGAPLVASVGLAAIFYAWLESFDASGRRQ
jgi:hypothetical protein